MSSYTTKGFHTGLKFIQDNEPCLVIESAFVKPGKGHAFNRVKLRKLLSGKVLEKNFKSGEEIKIADVVDVTLAYLYRDGEFWYFMNNETFEQLSADRKAVGESAKWLTEQTICILTLWNDRPISVTPPNFVELAIVETDPGLRGDTAGSGGKPATLSTGAVVKVPLFIQPGEVIKVDTRSGEYVSRVR